MFNKKDETWFFILSTDKILVWIGILLSLLDKNDFSKSKVAFEIILIYKNVVYHKFIPKGQTVNKKMFLNILHRLSFKNAVKRKYLRKWKQIIRFFCTTIYWCIGPWQSRSILYSIIQCKWTICSSCFCQ